MKYLLLFFSPILFAEPLTCSTADGSVFISRSTLKESRLIYTSSVTSETLAKQELTYVSDLCNKIVKSINTDLAKNQMSKWDCLFVSTPRDNVSLTLMRSLDNLKAGHVDLNAQNVTINNVFGSRVGFHTCAEVVQEYKMYLIDLKESKK